MRIELYVSSQATRKTRYALSDSQVTEGAVKTSMSADDLVSYLQAKQDYERWQHRIARAKRCGGGWV